MMKCIEKDKIDAGAGPRACPDFTKGNHRGLPLQKELPEGWKIIPFLKAAIVVSDEGNRVKQRDYLLEGKIPVIDQGQDFIGGYIDDENMAFKRDLPVIIFGDHTRNIKYVNRSFAVGAEGVKILKPESCYEPKFFYYMLHSLEIPSRGYSRHFQFLKKFDFPLAPTDEQKLIVSEIEKQFSRLDEAVAALKRVRAGLKRYKASVLKAAVKGKLTEEWRKENPDIEPTDKLLKRILAERKKKWEEKNPKKKYKEPAPPDTLNLPELPEGWAWATVGSLADNIHYGYTASSANDTVGPKLLRITDIQNNTVKWDAVPYCKIQSHEKQKYLLKDGDLVFARTGATVGKSFLIRGNIPEAVFASYLIRIILSNHTDKRFIYNFFQSLAYWMQIHKGKIGIGQPNVNAQTLSQIILPLPPLIEQQKIVEEIESRLSVTEEIEETININLKRAERLRQSILKKAFSGSLV